MAVLQALGLDPTVDRLDPIRAYFRTRSLDTHVAQVLALAGVSDVVMTNDPLDPAEAAMWERSGARDALGPFHAALRLDPILNDWRVRWTDLAARGYDVSVEATDRTLAGIRRWLDDCVERLQPRYLAVSLPDTFVFPAPDARTAVLQGAVAPACRDHGLPLSLMIGVRRQVNPAIRLAGDGVGRADLTSLERLALAFPDVRWLVSVLSRENQHELCVYARKFGTLMPFGCWWFLNNTSIVEEITRERLEMLGTSFIPQHSDARVLEHLIYKWRNTRRVVGPVLAAAYARLVADGRPVSVADIERDVTRLFRTNFERWTAA